MTDQTGSLVRRSGEPRRRRAMGPIEVPTGSDKERAKAKKYYCPSCGQVRRATPEYFLNPAIVDNTVQPHEFSTGTRTLEYCPGGTFDPEADAA